MSCSRLDATHQCRVGRAKDDVHAIIVITYSQGGNHFGGDLKLVEVGGNALADLIVFARALQGVTAGSLPGPDAGAPKSRVGVLKVEKVIGKEYIEFITGKEI